MAGALMGGALGTKLGIPYTLGICFAFALLSNAVVMLRLRITGLSYGGTGFGSPGRLPRPPRCSSSHRVNAPSASRAWLIGAQAQCWAKCFLSAAT
jgi:hypothetical protein